jgi:hypothetical protein
LEGKTTPDIPSSWYHCNSASRQVQRCHHSSQNLLLPKPKPTRNKDPTKKNSNNDEMKEAEQQQRCWIVEACSTKSI